MQRTDRLSALFFLALAVFVCQQSIEIGVGTLHRPGPALMSFGAGAGIGLLSLVLLIQILVSKSGRGEPPQDRGPSRAGKIVSIFISLFVYTIMVVWLGFVLSTFLFVLFLFRTVELEPWWRSTLKASLVTAGNYLAFVTWLGIDLPKGISPW